MVLDYEKGGCVKKLKGHNGWVQSITYVPNTEFIVSGSQDKTIKIWNYESN